METKIIVAAIAVLALMIALTVGYANASQESVSVSAPIVEKTCDSCCGGDCSSCCSDGICSKAAASGASGCGCGSS